MEKQELKERFERLFKGCTIYCVQLDGFSHALYYKDEKGQRHHADYSAYYSERHDAEEYMRYTKDGKAILYSFNMDRVKAFFIGFAHYCYQHNAQEIIFKDVKEW